MLYFLNFGFIAEQAIRDVLESYIDTQKFDRVYGNFHISVVNEHPFAHMIVDSNARAADNFPSIVVSTQRDVKVPDLQKMPNQITAISLNENDIKGLINSNYRIKKKITDKGEIAVIKKGEPVKEKIPGYVLIYDEKTVQDLIDYANKQDSKHINGVKISTRRRDSISVEIWAENDQLKNELYEHIRIFASTFLDKILYEKYKIFEPFVNDSSVSGDRSSNYNFDFDVVLSGSNITFEVDYDIAEIILDTEIVDIKNIYMEVMNHVKNF